MTLLRRAPDLSKRRRAVSLDLALGDEPIAAHLARREATAVDLVPQRRRRQPESGCRLSDREHLVIVLVARGRRTVLGVDVAVLADVVAPLAAGALAMFAEATATDAADGASLGGGRLGRVHLGDEFWADDLGEFGAGVRVHARNLAASRYLVKGVLS